MSAISSMRCLQKLMIEAKWKGNGNHTVTRLENATIAVEWRTVSVGPFSFEKWTCTGGVNRQLFVLKKQPSRRQQLSGQFVGEDPLTNNTSSVSWSGSRPILDPSTWEGPAACSVSSWVPSRRTSFSSGVSLVCWCALLALSRADPREVDEL